jgi:hypothetical protein
MNSIPMARLYLMMNLQNKIATEDGTVPIAKRLREDETY